jgi:hypothetical protein
LKDYRNPTVKEMIAAYKKVKAAGLKNICLGNLAVFASTEADQR